MLVLCDTNGGSMPYEVASLAEDARKAFGLPLGIHAHNDTESAVANSIMAVKAGCTHVQGTINGYGERCGNANLCSIIPNITLKMGYDGADRLHLAKLRDLSLFIDEMANFIPDKHKAYVGDAAFAHKGGIHVSAVRKNPETYEHIEPRLVGNRQRVLVSDLSGESTILYKAKELGIDIEKEKKVVKEVLRKVKELEHEGYQFEGAEGSLELLMKRALGVHKKYFDLVGFRVIVEKKEKDAPVSEATILVKVGEKVEHTAGLGRGPVHALDNALRKALLKFYPALGKRLSRRLQGQGAFQQGRDRIGHTRPDRIELTAKERGKPSGSRRISLRRAGRHLWTASITSCFLKRRRSNETTAQHEGCDKRAEHPACTRQLRETLQRRGHIQADRRRPET